MGMTENDTAAQRRQREEREQRTAEIRRLLDQPGGQDEVAKQFGKAELSSAEYRTAQRQRQAAQARRREAAENRAREARRGAEDVSSGADRPRTRQEMVDAQRKFERSGAKSAERSRDRAQSQSM